jgi:DNA-binding CsgD family transcriptional regulator
MTHSDNVELSSIELKILKLHSELKPKEEILNLLNITNDKYNSVIQSVKEKLNANTITHAVIIGIKRDIIG